MAEKNVPPDTPVKNFDRRRHTWIMQLVKDSRLTPTALRVGILLAQEYMNRKKGGLAWPAVPTLCADLGAGERNVRDAIQQLVALGHLFRENREGKTPFYSMRENAKIQWEKNEQTQGIGAADPCGFAHPSTPADLRADPCGFTSTTPADLRPEPLRAPAPKPIDEPSERTSVIEPRRSASPRADARESDNSAKENSIRQALPDQGGEIDAAGSSQADRNAEPKAIARTTRARTAGKIAKPPRAPLQIDMLAEDAKRTAVETLRVFREIYPTGAHHPHDDRAWQEVGAKMRAALKVAPAAEILAGATRYAASGQDPEFIKAPKNWLESRDWGKAYPPRTRRANAFDHTASAQRAQLELAAIAANEFGSSPAEIWREE